MELLKNILRVLAILTIKKYKPFIIGVTGTAGKTSTKNAIYAVLKSKYKVRMAGGNLNNEIGFPLAILGNYDHSGGAKFWLRVLVSSVKNLILGISYPKILILEYGADRPGDIGYLLTIAKPDIAVVTAIGSVPVHIEFYKDKEELVKEKAKLVRALPKNGVAILNYDDPDVLEMQDGINCKVYTFGLESGAEIKISSFENKIEFGKPIGISFKLEAEGSFVPIKIKDIFGRGQAYAMAAAAALGIEKGINLVDISDELSSYKGIPGRCRLINGIKDSYILDDTYNASPISMAESLKVLDDLKAPRRIAVLGDMLELGKYSSYVHEEIGKIIPGVANILVTVGPRSKFLAESAKHNGFPEANIYEFNNSDEAKGKVKDLIQSQDLILVKGSQSMRMEKIVAEIMANPIEAHEVLVRQYGNWLK